ncbi:MAG: DUF4876 domain-containing protein [Bacteroidaceae bacterium]|nr:DUF4876 domain-containing protein [Bacteroidaceae bacterium]
MKKVLFLSSLLCAALCLTTSCEDDEQVAKKYEVTVTVTADGMSLDSLKDFSLKCLNASGNEMAAQEGENEFVKTYKLIAGNYTLSGFASTSEFNFLGEQKFVVADKDMEVSLVLKPSPKVKGGIIFKELYYTGVPSYYFKDGFYELVNNSDEVMYLDGIIFTEIQRGYGATASTWMDSLGNIPADFYPLDGYVMQFPGNGTDYPVQPGQSVVIATQAYNHGTEADTPKMARELTDADEPSPAGDLSTADWELHLPAHANVNYDNPDVPSLKVIWSNATTYFWMLSVFGNPIALAKLPEGYADAEAFVNDSTNYHSVASGKPILCLPRNCIIDAVDIQRSGEEQIVKVFWPSEDAGYTYPTGANASDPDYAVDFDSWVSPSYSGKSIRRKCIMVTEAGRAYFKDTNNSTEDFILGGQTALPRRTFTAAD